MSVAPDLPVAVALDQSPRSGKPGILSSYMFGPQAVQAAALDPAERRDIWLRALAVRYGPKALSPRAHLETDWTAEDYNDSSWATGPQYGVGYDTNTAGPNALALIKTAVPAQTYSVYTRASFTIPDATALAAVTSMFLSTDYDDGYAAWINGVEVFRSPELPAGTLAFNTDAALHESSNGATPNYGALNDISLRGLSALHVGVNVLAIGVWNSNATTSTDLLLVPRLSLGEAERCVLADVGDDGHVAHHADLGLAERVQALGHAAAQAEVVAVEGQPFNELAARLRLERRQGGIA
jgi:hypothetical protein